MMTTEEFVKYIDEYTDKYSYLKDKEVEGKLKEFDESYIGIQYYKYSDKDRKEIIDLFEEKGAEYEKLVEEHRKQGDLIEFWVKEVYGNPYTFRVIEVFTTVREIIDYYEKTSNEFYNEQFDSYIQPLLDEHKSKGEIEKWIIGLSQNSLIIKESWTVNPSYSYISDKDLKDNLHRYVLEKYKFREYYSKIYKEHRKKGDLIDYLWELSKNYNLPMKELADKEYRKGCSLIGVLNYPLKNSEREELEILDELRCHFPSRYIGYPFEDFIDYVFSNRTWKARYYMFKLSQCNSDSIEFKRYQKIRSQFGSYDLDRLKDYINTAKKVKLGLKIGTLVVLILVASLCIGLHVTKDARMAKKEAQRIERVKIKEAKELEKAQAAALKKQAEALKQAEKEQAEALKQSEKVQAESLRQTKKAQAYDLKQVEKLAGKIAPLDILVQTPEPSMYVIAPMAYDTKKFAQDNSHDSAMFGFKTVDNSVKRLGILENCITDFQNKVDGITGVSFLDRSKISQIEKEHKFQLGDWSNNKKTAEIGKALNANILMFLDKFTYVDVKSGEYRFEAKFIDVSTMQTALFNVVYKNPKKKVVTPEVVAQISFKDFTPVSTKNDSFDDELSLKTQNVIRTVQNKNIKTVSPLGKVKKLETSEFDVNVPKTEFYNAVAINFDGFGELEMNDGKDSVSYPYTFDANEIYLERNGSVFYTDGKIGVLTVKTEKGYEKFDVFTNNNREYYIRLGSVELEKAFVNYYLQMVKK